MLLGVMVHRDALSSLLPEHQPFQTVMSEFSQHSGITLPSIETGVIQLVLAPG